MGDLERQFKSAIGEMVTRTLRETSYRPHYFQQMIKERGELDASLSLVRAKKPSDGFTKLWELKRLDLTVEAVVSAPEFAALFSASDIVAAKRRLKQYGYEAGE